MSPFVAPRERVISPEESPLARVTALGSHTPVALYLVIGLALHGALGAGAFSLSELAPIGWWFGETRGIIVDRLTQTIDIETEKKEEPPPPPPAEKEPEPEPEPVKTKEPAKEDSLPSPPALAQASQVLTQKADPNEPVDLTGNAFVTGTADKYAGGTTVWNGKNDKPATSPAAAATGVVGGTGTAPQVAGPDNSRAAGLLGSTDWSDCPFPPEADAEQIDQALVTLQVNVAPDGRATSVSVVSDPGHGFGRAAKSCANQKRYQTAQDRTGASTGGQTKPFRVRFRR